jgi:hypothetical protein
LDTVEALECANIVEAVVARWRIVIVLKTVVTYEFIQQRCSKGNPGLHFRLERDNEA